MSVETPDFEGSVVSRRDVELDPVEHGVKVEYSTCFLVFFNLFLLSSSVSVILCTRLL